LSTKVERSLECWYSGIFIKPQKKFMKKKTQARLNNWLKSILRMRPKDWEPIIQQIKPFEGEDWDEEPSYLAYNRENAFIPSPVKSLAGGAPGPSNWDDEYEARAAAFLEEVEEIEEVEEDSSEGALD
jgi:cytochrome c556